MHTDYGIDYMNITEHTNHQEPYKGPSIQHGTKFLDFHRGSKVGEKSGEPSLIKGCPKPSLRAVTPVTMESAQN